jgi:ubiquinone/menaquinone biosynthesis C-methylase UbiE
VRQGKLRGMSSSSVAFDRAASYYDETRGLPDDAMAELSALLVEQLAGRRPVLEIGVGTGRIALPLARAGVPMVGVDLARPMLDVLRRKDDAKLVRVVHADATQLPFADSSFDAAVASHVFHLIPDSGRALDELTRVLRAQSRLLVAAGGDHDDDWRTEVREFFRGACRAERPAAHDERRITALTELEQRASSAVDLPEVEVNRDATITDMIDRLEAGQWSWSWDLPDDRLHAAAEETRVWARDTYGDLDVARATTSRIGWRCYDLP